MLCQVELVPFVIRAKVENLRQTQAPKLNMAIAISRYARDFGKRLLAEC
jgi:hypothetical protein